MDRLEDVMKVWVFSCGEDGVTVYVMERAELEQQFTDEDYGPKPKLLNRIPKDGFDLA